MQFDSWDAAAVAGVVLLAIGLAAAYWPLLFIVAGGGLLTACVLRATRDH